MKKYYLTFLFSLLFVSLNAQQWQFTDGPYSRTYVDAMAQSGNYQFASGFCAIFRRSGTGNWKKVISNSANEMWVANDTLFLDLKYSDGLLYMPVNAAADSLSWPKAYTLRTDWSKVAGFDINDSIKIIMTSRRGIEYTYDHKSSIGAFPGNLPFDTIGVSDYRLLNFDVKLIDNTVFLLTKKGLFSSGLDFSSWTPLDTSLPYDLIRGGDIYWLNNKLLLGLEDELYLSNDTGKTFTSLNNFSSDLLNLVYHNNTYYASTRNNGLFRSTDGGNIWRPANNSFTNPHGGSLHSLGSDLYYSNYEVSLVYQGVNGWQTANTRGLNCLQNYDIVEKSGKIFYATRFAIQKRNPAITGWSNTFSPDSIVFESVQRAGPVLAAPYVDFYANWSDRYGVYYSVDDGNNWQSFTITSNFALDDLLIVPGNGGLFMSSGQQLFFTTDYGQTIQDLSSSYAGNLPDVYDMEWHHGKLYLVTYQSNGLLVKDGNNWNTVINTDFAGGEGSKLFKWGADLYYFSGGFVFKVDSTGVFQNIATGFSDVYSVANYNEHLFIQTDEREIYHTADTAATWNNISPSGLVLGNLAATADSLYTSSFTGVYSYPMPESVVSSEEFPLGNSPTLYPNPTTDYFQLDFSHQQMADYKILSSSGELVQAGVLQKGQRMDISDFAKGIYFIRVLLGDKWHSQKLIVN